MEKLHSLAPYAISLPFLLQLVKFPPQISLLPVLLHIQVKLNITILLFKERSQVLNYQLCMSSHLMFVYIIFLSLYIFVYLGSGVYSV